MPIRLSDYTALLQGIKQKKDEVKREKEGSPSDASTSNNLEFIFGEVELDAFDGIMRDYFFQEIVKVLDNVIPKQTEGRDKEQEELNEYEAKKAVLFLHKITTSESDNSRERKVFNDVITSYENHSEGIIQSFDFISRICSGYKDGESSPAKRNSIQLIDRFDIERKKLTTDSTTENRVYEGFKSLIKVYLELQYPGLWQEAERHSGPFLTPTPSENNSYVSEEKDDCSATPKKTASSNSLAAESENVVSLESSAVTNPNATKLASATQTKNIG